MLKFLGVHEDKAELLLNALQRWGEYCIYDIDPDGLYNININTEVPVLLEFNHPTIRFILGVNIIELDISEFVSISII